MLEELKEKIGIQCIENSSIEGSNRFGNKCDGGTISTLYLRIVGLTDAQKMLVFVIVCVIFRRRT